MQQIPPDEANVRLNDPGAPEVVESGVWRIPLPLPFALRSANVYLLRGEDEWVLVDAGLGTSQGRAALDAGLRLAGIGPDCITTIVLTHAHPDHVGLSGVVHAVSGAPVRMLEREAERAFQVWGTPDSAAWRDSGEMYRIHGMPAGDEETVLRGHRAVTRAITLPPRTAFVPLADGETVRLAGADYRVIWTPGHSDYHLCLLRADGLFIAGDHVLPRITPNIGLYPRSRPNPLRDYRESLARVRDLPARLVLPGHGRPFADLSGRVDELLAHHEERAAATLAALEGYAGGADAYALARDLFGERLRTPDDHRFALAEMLAHLEALREVGLVARSERAGHVTFAVAARVSAD